MDSDAFGRSGRVSDGFQDPSQRSVMAPGTRGLVQYDVKGYLAEPLGKAINVGALFITGFEQVISRPGSDAGERSRPIAATSVDIAGTASNSAMPIVGPIHRRSVDWFGRANMPLSSRISVIGPSCASQYVALLTARTIGRTFSAFVESLCSESLRQIRSKGSTPLVAATRLGRSNDRSLDRRSWRLLGRFRRHPNPGSLTAMTPRPRSRED